MNRCMALLASSVHDVTLCFAKEMISKEFGQGERALGVFRAGCCGEGVGRRRKRLRPASTASIGIGSSAGQFRVRSITSSEASRPRSFLPQMCNAPSVRVLHLPLTLSLLERLFLCILLLSPTQTLSLALTPFLFHQPHASSYRGCLAWYE